MINQDNTAIADTLPTIDELLEKLYNSAWVEGNNYDGISQAGIDMEVRSAKEIKRCNLAKHQLEQLIARERIDELELGAEYSVNNVGIVHGRHVRSYADRIAQLQSKHQEGKP